MADDTVVRVVQEGLKNLVVRLTNVSDGTGETDAVKIVKSSLVGLYGREPQALTLLRGEFTIQGFEAVEVAFDRTPKYVVAVMSGDDYRGLELFGGVKDLGSGGTGNVLVSTLGTASPGDTYDLTLHFKKKP